MEKTEQGSQYPTVHMSDQKLSKKETVTHTVTDCTVRYVNRTGKCVCLFLVDVVQAINQTVIVLIKGERNQNVVAG